MSMLRMVLVTPRGLNESTEEPSARAARGLARAPAARARPAAVASILVMTSSLLKGSNLCARRARTNQRTPPARSAQGGRRPVLIQGSEVTRSFPEVNRRGPLPTEAQPGPLYSERPEMQDRRGSGIAKNPRAA